jgi:hypothetical protein
MRRTPRFHNFDEMLTDADSLLASGYGRVGNWSLGQTCDHLSKTMERSLDGFPSKMSLPFRVLARWFALGGILKHKQFKRRFPAPRYLEPPEVQDDRAALQRLHATVSRLKSHPGELQPHPVFGKLTRSQWQEVHLWHCEHHFSFLTPGKATQPA